LEAALGVPGAGEVLFSALPAMVTSGFALGVKAALLPTGAMIVALAEIYVDWMNVPDVLGATDCEAILLLEATGVAVDEINDDWMNVPDVLAPPDCEAILLKLLLEAEGVAVEERTADGTGVIDALGPPDCEVISMAVPLAATLEPDGNGAPAGK
jgi:hypothetical protein